MIIFSQKSGGMKGKPLLPTLRLKKRYVVYEIITYPCNKNASTSDFSGEDVYRAVETMYKKCFGSFGLGESGLMDTKVYSKNRGIFKIGHKHAEKLKTAMAMVTNIKNKPVIVNTVSASGILKKAKWRMNNATNTAPDDGL